MKTHAYRQNLKPGSGNANNRKERGRNMGRIKNTNYYVTNGWMINELGLNGRELQVYAIIYGFTQDEESEFNGSLTYIAEWLGTSNKTTVKRAIDALLKKGVIAKRQTVTNGVKSNFYKAILPYSTKTSEQKEGSTETVPGVVPNRYRGSTETVPGGSTETVPNNYRDTKHHNDNDNSSVKPDEKSDPVPYEKIKKLYNEICTSFSKVVTVSPNRKKAIAARWKEYGGDLATFETLFKTAEASDFLKGKNDRNWTATFDWLLKADNMAKVLEGNYRNKGEKQNANAAGTSRTKPGAGTDKPAPGGNVRAITTAELEDKLRKSGQFKGYPDFNAMFGGKTAGTAEQSAGGN